MGYRSEVGLCLAGPAQAKLEAGLLRLGSGEGTDSAENGKLILELFELATLRKDEASGASAYHWPSLKWYPDYPEVVFVENFLAQLDEGDYYFIRLGESDDDSEFRGDFWDNPFQMSLTRAIAFE
jgi:hypothetical protein